MGGVFRPEQQLRIRATDDPELAKVHGLTEWDDERGQFVAPAPAPVAKTSAPAKLPSTSKGAKAPAGGGSGDGASTG